MESATAIDVVTAPENLSLFAERGFRTVDKTRVLATLTRSGLDPGASLAAARDAVESVGGLVVNAESDPGLTGGRSSWRYIYEVWMVPEDAGRSQAA